MHCEVLFIELVVYDLHFPLTTPTREEIRIVG